MKLIIEYKTKRVTGVEYASRNNKTKLNTVVAKKKRKEMRIFSASAIHSPKIMLSGIEPREELEKYGINVIYQL